MDKFNIFILFLAVILTFIAAIGSAQREELGRWNTTNNETEELLMAAIGRYAPHRLNYGVDHNGRLRRRW